MPDPDITLHKTSNGKSFSPATYPKSGTVQRGDTITFKADQASGGYVTFYAQSGLFYVPPGSNSGSENNGDWEFTAPAASSVDDLTLYVAANPATNTGYTISFSPVSAADEPGGGVGDPSDGTINVRNKPTEWRDPAPQHHAPAPAMPARGSD
ncbi:MAG TPA: hypothetical protein VF516_28090 [Kofleriaceae bacterium]